MSWKLTRTRPGIGDLYAKANQLPSLDLAFGDTQSLTDQISGKNLITYTRPSAATYFNRDGRLVTAAPNEPRFQFDAVAGRFGYLHEPAATNQIRNNSGVGAVAGTPGTLPTNWALSTEAGLTRQIIGTGTEDGIAYLEVRYSGTSSISFVRLFQGNANDVAANNTSLATWTVSHFARVVGTPVGVTGFRTVAFSLSGALAVLETFAQTTQPLTTAWTRYSHTATATNASTAHMRPAFDVMLTGTGVSVDFTLRIGLSQLETGTVATSPIVTAGSAVTRAADTMSVTGTDFSQWYNTSGMTFYAEYYPAQANNGGNESGAFCITNGNFGRGWGARFIAGTQPTVAYRDGVTNSALSFTSSPGSIHKTAFFANLDTRSASMNGAAVQSDSTALTISPAVDRMFIGRQIIGGSAGFFPVTLYRITAFPPGPAQTRLQQLTAA